MEIPHSCSNCGKEFLRREGLVALEGNLTAAALCGECLEGVQVVKLVLKRDSDGAFRYQQFSPVEMVDRAFGKVYG